MQNSWPGVTEKTLNIFHSLKRLRKSCVIFSYDNGLVTSALLLTPVNFLSQFIILQPDANTVT